MNFETQAEAEVIFIINKTNLIKWKITIFDDFKYTVIPIY